MKKKLTILLAATLLLLPSGASGQETTLLVMGVSHHVPLFKCGSPRLASCPDMRDLNPGLGVEWDLGGPWHALAGTYLNSYDRPTLFIAGGVEGRLSLPLRPGLGAEVGLVTGYPLPIALLPYAVLGLDRADLKIYLLPPDLSSERPVLGLGLQARLHL